MMAANLWYRQESTQGHTENPMPSTTSTPLNMLPSRTHLYLASSLKDVGKGSEGSVAESGLRKRTTPATILQSPSNPPFWAMAVARSITQRKQHEETGGRK